MRDITYKTLDYLYEKDRVRKVWLAITWLGLLMCTYAFVVAFIVLMIGLLTGLLTLRSCL